MKYLPFILSLFISHFSFAQRGGQLSQNIKNPIFRDTRDQTNDPLSGFQPIYPVGEMDIFWAKEVLRSIDLSEQPNDQLLHIKTANNTNQTITSILLQAVGNNYMQAFANVHDSTALNNEDAMRLVTNSDTTAMKKIFLLERWQFNPSIKKMVVSIIGIAPCRFERKGASHCKEVFWLKYTALRPMLEQNYIANMTVYDFFENRQFTSKILNITTVDTVYYKR